MTTSSDDFVADLTQIEFLRTARNEALEEWGGDVPPTLLFSAFGRCIAERFEDFAPQDRVHIFGLVEAGVMSSDTSLKTLVATGLLEALFSHGSSNDCIWPQIDAQLGAASKDYLAAWGKLFGEG